MPGHFSQGLPSEGQKYRFCPKHLSAHGRSCLTFKSGIEVPFKARWAREASVGPSPPRGLTCMMLIAMAPPRPVVSPACLRWPWPLPAPWCHLHDVNGHGPSPPRGLTCMMSMAMACVCTPSTLFTSQCTTSALMKQLGDRPFCSGSSWTPVLSSKEATKRERR